MVNYAPGADDSGAAHSGRLPAIPKIDEQFSNR